MKMINTIIFDLYGTLVKLQKDTKPFLTLAKRGKKKSVRESIELSLTTEVANLEDYCHLIDLEPQDDIDRIQLDLKQELCSAELFDDTLSTLISLKRDGIKLALISNLATPYKKVFYDLGLNNYFDVAIFSCDAGIFKPDPQIYSLALKSLSTNPENALMVGDNQISGVKGPEELGVKSYRISRSNNSTLTQISSITDLRELLLLL